MRRSVEIFNESSTGLCNAVQMHSAGAGSGKRANVLSGTARIKRRPIDELALYRDLRCGE